VADTGTNRTIPFGLFYSKLPRAAIVPNFGSQIKIASPLKVPDFSTLSPSPPLYLFPHSSFSSPSLRPLFSDHDPPQFEDPEMKEASFVGTLLSPISPMRSLMCILFFSFLVRKSCGVDPQFQRCSVPQNCGDGQNITFPFFIQATQQQNYSCGHPGFPVSCNINRQPTFTLSDINYTIHQIFYQNQTIHVSNPDFSKSNTDCIPLTKNISLPSIRFELVPNQSNLLLLYNCSNNSSSLPR
jgi:hypothetical protein